jgi:uncharacterized protein
MKKTHRQFQVFAKPTSALCNLDCAYCYYVKKKQLYADSEATRMHDDILDAYIDQHISASPGSVTHFTWHGGEPTLLGLDYFRKIMSLQKKHTPPDHGVANNIQTNGTLLDEAWCRFLSEEGFSVGLSLDGPEEMHDKYRLTGGGKTTHRQVMRGLELLQRHRVAVDILCVVHAGNVQHPSRVYRFFRNNGVRYMGFIPLVEQDIGGEINRRSIAGEAWGDFLCAIYDEWKSRDIGRIKVQMIEEVARTALGHGHALCIFRETCGDVPAVEHNGDFYSCDHFVDPEHCLGNIANTPLVELLESSAQKAFGKAKSDMLPRYCLACDELEMCQGGCPKDRILETPDGEKGLNFLCRGYKRFFEHCRPFLRELSAQGRKRYPLGQRHPDRPVGRNAPCPCGSGRKYKHCCMR